MLNYYGSRLIKLISPNTDEVFSLELDGDERELKELLATLINIPVNSIKGIRDSYGNYFTISSAIHNPNITLNQNTFFSVIINTKSMGNDTYSREESERKKLSPKISQSENTHSTTNYPENLPEQKRSSAVVDQNEPLFNIDNMSPIRKINQLPSNSSNSSLVNAIDKYHQIALQMINQKVIEEKYFQILKAKLLEENEEVISLFKQYMLNEVDINKLRAKLIPLLSQGNKCHRDSIYQRFTYSNVLNSLAEYFDNPNDISLLNQLLQCDNDLIIKALDAYDFNHDQQKLIDSLQAILKKYRGRFNDSQTVEMPDTGNNIQNNNFITSILDLKVVDSPPEKTNNKMDKNKQNVLKEIASSIEKQLRFDYSALFSYEVERKTKEKVLLDELKISPSQKDDIPYENVKQFYKGYFRENIAYDFSTKERELYEEIAKGKEKRLVELYSKFAQSKNLETLSNKVRLLLNKIEEERDFDSSEEEDNEEEESEESNVDSDSSSFDTNSSHGDASEEENHKNNIRHNNTNLSQKNNKSKSSGKPVKGGEQVAVTVEVGGEKQSSKKNVLSPSDDGDSKKVADFMKVVNKMAFGDDVKAVIFRMLSSKNEKMMKVYENFQRNKMSLTKNVLLQVVKQPPPPKVHPIKNNLSILTQLNAKPPQQAPQASKKESFEDIAKEFLQKKAITSLEYDFLISSFNAKDELLYSFWELYLDDPSKDELFESIKMYFAKGSIQKKFDSFKNLSSKPQAWSLSTAVKNEGKTVQSKMERIMKENSFTEGEKQLLRDQLKNENQMLLSILEGFEAEEDSEDAAESLKILLSKLKCKK